MGSSRLILLGVLDNVLDKAVHVSGSIKWSIVNMSGLSEICINLPGFIGTVFVVGGAVAAADGLAVVIVDDAELNTSSFFLPNPPPPPADFPPPPRLLLFFLAFLAPRAVIGKFRFW